MGCDICGKENKLVKVEIEGTFLNVCSNCSKFGKIIEDFKEDDVNKINILSRNKKKNERKVQEFTEVFVSDYSMRIKNAREKLGLTQKELGEKVAEKESVIHKLESGSMNLNFKLAKKFEKYLGIKLVEFYEEENIKKIDFKDSNVTIGDLIKMKK